MSSKPDGGRAFPSDNRYNDDGDLTAWGSPGLTIRDYFAGKVIEMVYTRLANPTGMASEMAKIAYTIADAMIAERSK